MSPAIKSRIVKISTIVISAVALVAGWYVWSHSASTSPAKGETAAEDEAAHEVTASGTVRFAESKWKVAGIQLAPVARTTLPQTQRVTGTLTLNEDRQAQIFPQVEGVVHQVRVHFGEQVTAGQTLAVIDSQQIGLAKLELIKARLDRRLAEVDFQWETLVEANVQKLISALKKKIPLRDIENEFAGSDMGDYRAQLISAYARLYKSQADHDRLKGLSDKGITAGKDFLTAESSLEADLATMQAMLEQTRFTARQRRITSEQTFEKAKTAESISELNLKILGVTDTEQIGESAPSDQESFSHYTITAPFDGSIILKDITLEERVDPTGQLFTIADLSTLWVRANVFEQQIPLVESLQGKAIQFRTASYPDRVFEGQVFSTGSVIDPQTRTLPLTATVENPDRLLKAGMFIDIDFPGQAVVDALLIRSDAILVEANQPFVFVHLGDDQFERRNVQTGRTGEGSTEINAGLREGESVVVEGAFFLKSEMLADQFADDE
ncbi:MAG: efflux RND transporter periplasmic adaptor subunit [Planctomycetaceae bacterium]